MWAIYFFVIWMYYYYYYYYYYLPAVVEMITPQGKMQ